MRRTSISRDRRPTLGRDTEAIKRICTGFLKLLFPHVKFAEQISGTPAPQIAEAEDTSCLDARMYLNLNGIDLGISVAESQSKLGKPSRVEHLDNRVDLTGSRHKIWEMGSQVKIATAHQLNHETRTCPKPCPVNRPTPANSPNLASNMKTLFKSLYVASTL